MYRAILLLSSMTVLLGACAKPVATPAASSAAEPATASALSSVKDLDSRNLTEDPETWPGAAVYQQACQSCHEGQIPKAPHKMFLQMMSAPTILASLTDGLMREQASGIAPAERQQVAEYLAGTSLATAVKPTPIRMCSAQDSGFDAAQPPLPAGWGYDNARFIGAAEAGITPQQAARLELKWAFEFPSALRARSQPAIAWGAVFVGSHDGHVYALDLQSGCARWTFKAGAEVRTAVVPYTLPPVAGQSAGTAALLFGDVVARLYAVDARNGALLWSAKMDEHPNATLTGSPTVHDGRAYVPLSSLEVTTAADPNYPCCSFRGSVAAVELATGTEIWRAYTIPNPPSEVRKTSLGVPVLAPSGAPVWNSPTVDSKRGLIYVGTGENYSSPANDTSDALLAFRMSDGGLAWSQQTVAGDAWNVACMMENNPNCPAENGPDVDFGAGTILTTLPNGKDIILAGQKNGVVYAFDPDAKGKQLWNTRVGRGGIQGGIHFGMALDGTTVLAPVSDMADGRDGRPVEGPPRPGLYALDAATGRQLWATPANNVCKGRQFCDPGISAAITAIPGVVFAGHMDGRFRAYNSRSGKVLFEHDATRDTQTVSGAVARGGSFGGAGAAVRDGYVVVNSGYGLYFHMPGNLLLTFAPRD